jgi:phage shock protein PspC (stress-responsive transcriptional regulator)
MFLKGKISRRFQVEKAKQAEEDADWENIG